MNDRIIRKAHINEIEDVISFYYQLIDDLEGATYSAKWTKDVYPTKEDLKEHILKQTLYIMVDENKTILSAMVLNQGFNEGYDHVHWRLNVSEEYVLILHLLGVGYLYQHQGIAKEMVKFALDEAKSLGALTVRLDILPGNKPAEVLYKSCGFKEIETIEVYYPDTGLAPFTLMDYIYE